MERLSEKKKREHLRDEGETEYLEELEQTLKTVKKLKK